MGFSDSRLLRPLWFLWAWLRGWVRDPFLPLRVPAPCPASLTGPRGARSLGHLTQHHPLRCVGAGQATEAVEEDEWA